MDEYCAQPIVHILSVGGPVQIIPSRPIYPNYHESLSVKMIQGTTSLDLQVHGELDNLIVSPTPTQLQPFQTGMTTLIVSFHSTDGVTTVDNPLMMTLE